MHSLRWLIRKYKSSDGSSWIPIVKFGDNFLICWASDSAVAQERIDDERHLLLILWWILYMIERSTQIEQNSPISVKPPIK
jgi:hypothetical protein